MTLPKGFVDHDNNLLEALKEMGSALGDTGKGAASIASIFPGLSAQGLAYIGGAMKGLSPSEIGTDIPMYNPDSKAKEIMVDALRSGGEHISSIPLGGGFKLGDLPEYYQQSADKVGEHSPLAGAGMSILHNIVQPENLVPKGAMMLGAKRVLDAARNDRLAGEFARANGNTKWKPKTLNGQPISLAEEDYDFAKQLLNQGESMKDIKEATGWEVNPRNDKLEYELSDAPAQLVKRKKVTSEDLHPFKGASGKTLETISDGLRHPELYGVARGDIPLLSLPYGDTKGTHHFREYSDGTSETMGIGLSPQSAKDMRSTTLHELSHSLELGNEAPRGGSDLMESFDYFMGGLRQPERRFQFYQSALGESAARRVQNREDLTSDEVKKSLFYDPVDFEKTTGSSLTHGAYGGDFGRLYMAPSGVELRGHGGRLNAKTPEIKDAIIDALRRKDVDNSKLELDW